MPSRNIVRFDTPESSYHVYARGGSKQPIFLDDADQLYFCKLLERYLSIAPGKNKLGDPYPHFRGRVELQAYCLMGNHFHLLVYEVSRGDLAAFMQSLITSYTRYFNLRYKRTGRIFESRYKAARIDTHTYLMHISRYIHLNPRYWRRYRHSSVGFYAAPAQCPEWLQPEKIAALFASPEAYLEFLRDYEDHKAALAILKAAKILADT